MSTSTHRKRRIGLVVSDRMEKTVVVQISRKAMHPLYRKYIAKRVKYKVHAPNNTAANPADSARVRVGDRVEIEETRPLSREKHWRVVRVVARAPEA